MSDLDALKENIMKVIKDNEYNLEDLKEVLAPISIYTENPTFKNNIDEIIAVVTKDRDGNHKFTLDDLKLLGNDIMGVTSLITAVLLLVGSIPQMKLEYSANETEEIVFKLLAYLFLVVIPKQTGNPWSVEEKEQVLGVALVVYNMIKSSQLVQDLVNKVKKWLQSKKWCKCLASNENPALDEKLPGIKLDLQAAMENVRDKQMLMSEIRLLKSRMA
jgi:hypothetical protein